MSVSFDEIMRLLDQHPDISKKIYEQLRERFATVEQFQKLLEEIQASREESNKRFERVDKRLDEIQSGLGINFEGYNKNVLREFLKAQGIPADNMGWRVKIPDPEKKIYKKSTEVEIDLLLQDPLIIVEVTSIEHSIEKVQTFIKIIKWLEDKYSKNAVAYYLLFDFDDGIRDHAVEMLGKNNIKIIWTRT